MQKAEGTPESPICAITQKQLSQLHSGNQDGLHPVCPKLSLLKANRPLPSECPDFQKKKNRGYVSPEEGQPGTSTESKERGCLWTAGATPDSASNTKLPEFKQPLASIPLLFPPARPCPAQASGKCGPALALLLGLFLAETLERSRHSHCFSNNVVTKEQLDKSSGGTELSSDPGQKETCKSLPLVPGAPLT